MGFPVMFDPKNHGTMKWNTEALLFEAGGPETELVIRQA
jgi:hypothetical protein